MKDLAIAMRRLVWLAMIVSMVVYGAVAFVVTGAVERPDAALPSWLLPVLAGLLAVTAVLLYPRLTAEDEANRRRREDRVVIRPGEIAVWALDEAVAILGLVAAFLSGTAQFYVVYGVVAIFLLLTHRRRRS